MVWIVRFLVVLFVLGGTTFVMAQRSILVVDSETEQPMPFVKIIPDIGQPFFTDIDGRSKIEDMRIASLTLSFSGYEDTVVHLSSEFQLEIRMNYRTKEIEGVVVLPGENPAHRIIRQAGENRKNNHPLGKDAFTYESYSKFVFDVDSALYQQLLAQPDEDTDSSNIGEFTKLIKTQYLFLIESASERTYIPPNRDRENIIAYKASGLKNPLFSAFAQSMQSFHFYDNRFELLGKEYFNPIALGSINRYFFILEDSTVIGSDTTFLISFRPKPNVGIETMSGMLFINSNGFAIEKVIAQPSHMSDEGFKIRITQEYKLIDGKKWFPIDLKTNVWLGNAVEVHDKSRDTDTTGQNKKENSSAVTIEGRGTTYIKNIVLNPSDLKKRGFNNVALSTDPKAGDKTEEYWEALRKDSISEREKNTYIVLDSLSKVHKIEMKLNGLLALTTGRIRVKYVNLPIERILGFNLHEGYRIGLGLETSSRVMKNITVGSYIGYGIRDDDWKYGAYSTFNINRRWGLIFNMRYQQDLIHRGATQFASTNWDIRSPDLYAHFYQYRMDKQRLGEIRLTAAPFGNITVHLLGNYQRLNFTKDYLFTTKNEQQYAAMDVAETAVEMRWNIRQRILILGDIRMPQPTHFPRIKMKVTKGWNGIGRSSVDYWRLFVSINEDLKSFRFGQLSLYANASQTFGDVPLTFQQNAVGTQQNLGLVTAEVLETALPGEFFHDRQTTVITRYLFPPIGTPKGKIAPQFILHHGVGYGYMPERTATTHNTPFLTMDKGFFEGGVIFRNFVPLSKTLNFMKLGCGVFYRYGTYANKNNMVKNFVFKIDLSF